MINIKLRISLGNVIGLVLGLLLVILGGFWITIVGVIILACVAGSLDDVDGAADTFIDIDTTRKS